MATALFRFIRRPALLSAGKFNNGGLSADGNAGLRVKSRCRRSVMVRLLCSLIAFLVGFSGVDRTSAQSHELTNPLPVATTSACQNVIAPFNFDSTDPCACSRRGGALRLRRSACGRIWNRLFPSTEPCPVEPRRTEPCPISPSPAPPRPVAPEIRQIGTSVMGVPIIAHVFGSSGPKTLIFGAIHGDEPTTAHVTRQLVEHLTAHPEAFSERRVIVLPVANPDGLARRTRVNARQIDLNRNFPAKNFAVSQKGRYFGGEQPASEPETQSLILLIDDWQPDRIITIHAIARGKHGNNFDGPGEALAQLMSHHNKYAVLPSIGYPTPGSFGSWSGIDRQTPTITLELPSDAAGESCWQECREALLAVIQAK